MTWEIILLDGLPYAWKVSDARNWDMYLVDELGQHYDHFEEVTGAAGKMSMLPHVVYEGSFYFPLPMNGARRFDFHNEVDQLQHCIVTAVLP